MRCYLLPLLAVCAVVPSTAWAEPATLVDAPCDFVDREMMDALKLVDAKKTMDHKDVPATKESPQQRVNICSVTPGSAPLPSLSITTTMLPDGAKTNKLSCSEQSFPTVKVTMCNTSKSGVFATFVLVVSSSADEPVPRTFRAQLERRANQLEVAPGNAAKKSDKR